MGFRAVERNRLVHARALVHEILQCRAAEIREVTKFVPIAGKQAKKLEPYFKMLREHCQWAGLSVAKAYGHNHCKKTLNPKP